ncbi:MAG: apolipoprotein N-acyltransferase [Spiribacter sp.]|nr:apolipoprotein N-acyltransferase [Spiribacter sp.]
MRLFACLLLAFAAGLVMALGFAPHSFAWAPLLGLAIIFALSLAAHSWMQVIALGYGFGLGYAGLGVYWIYYSIADYGGGPLAAVLATSVLIALFAVIPMSALILGWLAGRRHGPALAMLAFALAWTLVEWVRSWLLTGATWLSVGYSQIDTPLASLAPIFGVYGPGLAVALLAASLGGWLLQPLSLRCWVPLAMGLVAALGGLLLERDWSAPSGEPISVALIQGNIEQARKWDPDERSAILAAYFRQSREAFGNDLIVWPETAVPVVYQQAQNGLERLANDAAKAGSQVIAGAPVAEPAGAGIFNSVAVLGEPSAFYHKRHLVPFGEYVPLRDVAGGILDFVGTPLGDFSAGSSAAPLQAAGHQIGVSICYEITFGAEIADALPVAEILLNVSNDAWFGRSSAPWQHLEMARMRALEMARPLLRATNTGVSAIIDSRGDVITTTALFTTTQLQHEIVPRQGETPYMRWRDWPIAGVSSIGWLAILLTGRRGYRLFRDV